MSAHAKKPVPGEGDDGWFDRNQFTVLKLAVGAIFLLVLLTGAYVSYQLFTLSDRTNQQGDTITALSQNLDSSRKQLQENGITPTVPPAKTVVEKIEKIYDEVGGFGQLLVFGFDYADNPQAWRHSLELLAKEVLPKVQHLKPSPAKLAAE